MAPVGDDDLDAFLDGFEVDVVVGSDTIKGILETGDELRGGLESVQVVSGQQSVRIRTDQADDLSQGGNITVDGEALKVIRWERIPTDGKYTRVVVRP